MSRDALGDKMKGHERAWQHRLFSRLPVIVRIDGKAFHTYTRSLHAHDAALAAAMWLAAETLGSEIMGAKCAYTQSDEISVLINPWASAQAEAWFDNDLQKVVSVCASIASAVLTAESPKIFGETRPAYFDARAFVLPQALVNDYFVWRQLDAHRNAVNALAQDRFSHKQLLGIPQRQVREMLREAGCPVETQPLWIQRGAMSWRCSWEMGETTRSQWITSHSSTQWFAAETHVINGLMGDVVTP